MIRENKAVTPMLCIVYISSARQKFSEFDVAYLIEQSTRNNARLQTTGILLYKDGDIMQLLEGPAENVRDLMNVISYDSRHHGIIRLLERKISERLFADWSMAFKDLGCYKVRKLTAFLDEQERELPSVVNPKNPMLSLLASFGYLAGSDLA
jgi:hypothetical protein